MNFKKSVLGKTSVALLTMAVFGNSVVSAAPAVTATSNSETLMNALFTTAQNISNVKVNGRASQFGTFSGAKNTIDLEDGVVLSTGYVGETFKHQGRPRGENGSAEDKSRTSKKGGATGNLEIDAQNDSPTIEGDYDVQLTGKTDDPHLIANETQPNEDNDIEKTAGTAYSYDAASLEFDVIPKGGKINFQYIFASNEWQEVFNDKKTKPFDKTYTRYLRDGDIETKIPTAGAPGDSESATSKEENEVGSSKPNDTAIIMVNGTNIAIIPETGKPISAESVMESSGYDTTKPAPDPYGEFGSKGIFKDTRHDLDFGFFGRTVLMNCEADVVPNEVNHIKIAIADIEDPFYNSAIFLKSNINEEHEVLEEEPNTEVINPKTGDVNLIAITATTFASATGLAVLVKKSRKK